MRRIPFPALCLSLALLCENAGCATTSGGTAPDLVLRDLDGGTVKLSDYLGKSVVLLDFWATWCRPCEALLPHVEALHARYKDQGLVVLGVAIDDTQTQSMVAPFAHKHSLTFPVLLDDGQAVQLYNPDRRAPYQVLIDRRGRIAKTREGYNAGDEQLMQTDIRRLLR